MGVRKVSVKLSQVVINRQVFVADSQGCRFRDVYNDARFPFDGVLDWLNDAERQKRLVDSEKCHHRPALAGVIAELEQLPEVRKFFERYPLQRTWRYRQAIGVVVKIVMAGHGWIPAGKKGFLRGLSKYFGKAERYILQEL